VVPTKTAKEPVATTKSVLPDPVQMVRGVLKNPEARRLLTELISSILVPDPVQMVRGVPENPEARTLLTELYRKSIPDALMMHLQSHQLVGDKIP
jgi:hypothetical protein